MKRPWHSRELPAVVWPASIASGSLVAQHVAGKATRDTLFLTQFGLGLLPAAMIGAALVSAVSLVGISRGLRRWGPARALPAMFAISAVLYLLEWSLSLTSQRAAAIAVYLHGAVFGSAITSAFWSLVNERFDPHSAKRIVGRIASGGTVGGVLGGLVVWRASSHLSVPMMLALLAAINLVGLLASLWTARGHTVAGAPPDPPTGGGWRVVRETPYLRDLALLVLSAAVVQALLDWLLSAHASRQYGNGPELLAFFALFNMVVGVLSFAAQTGLSRPLLEWRGLAGTVRSHPVTVGVFAGVALLSPHLWPIVLLRGAESVARNSVYRSAYELFYTPLATAKKRATKTIIDVGADRVGTAVGSVALLAVIRLDGEVATRVVLLGAVTMAALVWLLAARLHDGYVSALASSLKTGAIALDDEQIQDLTTRKTLAETAAFLDREKLLGQIARLQSEKEGRSALGATGPPASSRSGIAAAPSPAEDLTPGAPTDLGHDPVVMRAAALRSGDVAVITAALSAPLTPDLASFALPLLANEAVVRHALRALREIAPRATGQLLDALLDPEVDARVRRRIPRVLKVCRSQRAASGMLMALKDPVFDVRVQVGMVLSRMKLELPIDWPRDEVFDLVLHELTHGRASWCITTHGEATPRDPTDDELQRGLAHAFTVLGLVLESEPLLLAHRAMRSAHPGLRGTALEYLEVVLPRRLREVVMPLLGDASPRVERRARGSRELADELLRSSAAVSRRGLTTR